MVVLLVSDSAAIGLLALCLRSIADLAFQRRPLDVLVPAAGGALCFLAINAGASTWNSLLGNLGERVGLRLDEEALTDTTGVPSIAHIEHPGYLDRLALALGAGRNLVRAAWAAPASAASFLGMAGSLALLVRVHPALAILIAFAAAPLLLSRAGERWIRAASLASAEDTRIDERLFSLLVRPGPGKEIRAFGCGDFLIDRMSSAWRRASERQVGARSRAATVTGLGWTLFMLGYVGALALIASMVSVGQRTPGDLVMTIVLAAQLRGQVERSFLGMRDALAGIAVVEPFLWLRAYATRARDAARPMTTPPARLRRGIRVEAVTFRYPNARGNALQDVSVHLPAGAVVAVVGEYGSGKSTLVKLLYGLHRPARGRVTVDGVDLADVDPDAWRAATSVLLQDFGRYEVTLREAIGMGDLAGGCDDDRVVEAAGMAGAGALVRQLPGGLDTPLGSEFQGVELSEGQWQKVALARGSMRRRPLLVVMDEPTAALDAPSERAMFERYITLMRRWCAETGAVCVVVTHRLASVAAADLIVVMSEGRVVEAGVHAGLIEAGGHYAAMLRGGEA